MLGPEQRRGFAHKDFTPLTRSGELGLGNRVEPTLQSQLGPGSKLKSKPAHFELLLPLIVNRALRMRQRGPASEPPLQNQPAPAALRVNLDSIASDHVEHEQVHAMRYAVPLNYLAKTKLTIDRFAQVGSACRDYLIRITKDFQVHELSFKPQPG